jgi:hypothetical protein
MGSFLLKNNRNKISENEIVKVFASLDQKKYIKLNLEDYSFFFFQRVVSKDSDCYEDIRGKIFLSGTFIYGKNSVHESLKIFFHDFLHENINYKSIYGQFVLVILIKAKLHLLTDRLRIHNVYFNNNKSILSSSFLAISTLQKRLEFNKNALIENLLTGSLIGPDTTFNNIKRLEKKDKTNFPGLNIIDLPSVEYNLSKKSRNELINNQINILDDYFTSIKKLANEKGAALGLTGGFDSRLLMCFAERHFDNIEYFSHWRKSRTKELTIAEKLTRTVDKKLNIYECKDPLEMTEEEAWANLKKGFYFYDGHIRTQAYWHEPYNNLDYLQRIYSNNYLGLNGIGGEQYRNCERMIRQKWNFWTWLKFEVLFRYSDNIFLTKKDEQNFLDYYALKIRRKLELGEKKDIDRLDLKRFHNEVYNVSNRAVRCSMENKAAFCLCPFADPVVSYKAYEITPQLGPSLSFESEMIKKINPQLAKIESEYGFNFYDGENFGSKMNGYIKEAIPKKLFFKIYHYKKGTRKNTFYHQYFKRYPFMKELDDLVDNIPITIDVKQLKNIRDTGWQLISLGFLLKKLKSQISL